MYKRQALIFANYAKKQLEVKENLPGLYKYCLLYTSIEMTENYRSARHPVDFANKFVKVLGKRMKSTPIISMRKENGWVTVSYTHLDVYKRQPQSIFRFHWVSQKASELYI